MLITVEIDILIIKKNKLANSDNCHNKKPN